jgi:hypothetical protein
MLGHHVVGFTHPAEHLAGVGRAAAAVVPVTKAFMTSPFVVLTNNRRDVPAHHDRW